MNIETIVNSVFDNLVHVSQSNPNERLPKEEQIRSRIFATLQSSNRVVCCERTYTPVGQGKEIECDIYIPHHNNPATWIEIKRCWSGSMGWVTKPAEQLRSWNKDLYKLKGVSHDDIRYFFLFGLFDFEPIGLQAIRLPGVIQNIRTFQIDHLRHQSSMEFSWRDENITHIGAWVWSWEQGQAIDVPELV